MLIVMESVIISSVQSTSALDHFQNPEEDKFFFGGYIASFGQMTAETCAEACLSHPDCIGFNSYPAETPRNCVLKDKYNRGVYTSSYGGKVYWKKSGCMIK